MISNGWDFCHDFQWEALKSNTPVFQRHFSRFRLGFPTLFSLSWCCTTLCSVMSGYPGGNFYWVLGVWSKELRSCLEDWRCLCSVTLKSFVFWMVSLDGVFYPTLTSRKLLVQLQIAVCTPILIKVDGWWWVSWSVYPEFRALKLHSCFLLGFCVKIFAGEIQSQRSRFTMDFQTPDSAGSVADQGLETNIPYVPKTRVSPI